MRKITKLMLTLMLLTTGVVGVNAEKLYSDFSEISGANTNASWDSNTKTMTWSAASYNFLSYTMIKGLSATDGFYDLSTWETITITFTLSGNSNQVRIRMKDNNGGDGDWVVMTGSGSHTYNITDFKKGGAALNYSKIAGFQLSGGGDAAGSATFTELYLERPDDPTAVPRENLNKLITIANWQTEYGKTQASFNELTAQIATAEGVRDNESATADELVEAKTALQEKLDALKLAEGYVKMTKDMFKTWESHESTDGTVNTGCSYKLNESDGLPYGLGTVDWKNFANLSGYDKLVIIMAEGEPRFCFNRMTSNGQDNDDESLSEMIDIPNNARSTAAYESKDGEKVFIIDLKKMNSDKGFAHLHCIKGRYNASVTVTDMLLYDALLTQKEALREKIAEASRYSITFYSAASYEALQTAIAAAEAAIVATNATAQSLTDAADALTAAINGLQINEGYRELVSEDFFQWDAVRNPTSRTSLEWHQAVVGTSTGQPFGDSSVDKLNYANLSQYDKLIVTVSAGAPRFLFNRDVDNGDWNANETESHLIDNTKGNAESWHAKYFSQEGNTYIVDLKQLVEDKGIANLNAIKGANWANVTVTGMYLYKEGTPDTYGIVGPLVGGWEIEDKEMTEGLMGMYSYTFPDEFQATESSYEYKLRANGNWDGYQLPANGNNTWTPAEAGGYYNLTIKADVLTNSLDVEAVPVTETHTATFTTNLDWENVYAFVWTEGKKTFLGEWPGTKLEATDGVYTVSFEATKGGVAPAQIIFSNGLEGDAKEQTPDLDFEDGKAYSYDLNYYVMSQDFFGSWNASEDGKMTKNEDGTYTWNKEGEELSADKAYKVMKDLGGVTTWYPDGENKVIGISMAGTYDIAISFNPADNSITEAMSIYKNISDAGYATYCSPYALNFDGTGVQAYIAKVEGNEVKFYEVTNAPANTGLLLKAAEGTYKVKMEAITGEGATDATGNALIGVLVDTPFEDPIFVLMNGQQGVGFYKTTKTFTVGANTAYITAPASARSFIGFDFDNTTTAIEGIAAEKNLNGEVYNLQGQRVVKAQKGLYISNGKKVVIK